MRPCKCVCGGNAGVRGELEAAVAACDDGGLGDDASIEVKSWHPIHSLPYTFTPDNSTTRGHTSSSTRQFFSVGPQRGWCLLCGCQARHSYFLLPLPTPYIYHLHKPHMQALEQSHDRGCVPGLGLDGSARVRVESLLRLQPPRRPHLVSITWEGA